MVYALAVLEGLVNRDFFAAAQLGFNRGDVVGGLLNT
jgi:hypothetical protein